MPMSEAKTCSAEFHGASHTLDAVSRELEAQEADGYAFVALRFGFAGGEAEPLVDIKAASDFLIQFRDEIIRAKQKAPEWETNTDPESGIAEGC
jgi:hypothetical protein